jgi:outer membrane protein OmpA-like peptidoglycan-associated protein
MSIRVLLLLSFIFTTGMAQGQSYIKSSSKKLQKCYKKAAESAQINDYTQAIEHTDKILKKEPDNIDVLLRRGSYYHSTKNYARSEADFQKAISLNPDYDGRAYYTLGLSQYEQEKFEEANQSFQKFIDSNSKSTKLKKKAQALMSKSSFAAEAIKNPVPFNPIRLSENINTEKLEYYPSITADGKQMIYLTNDGNLEDIYISTIEADGTYGKGKPFSAFNVRLGEGAHCISADGKTIVFTSCDERPRNVSNTYGSCDLFISYLVNGKWSLPENMGAQINSRAMDTQPNLGADGKTLYFSSKRSGNSGADLYLSKKQKNNQWSKPIKLSDDINTPGDDESPFMHPDGKTFYFRSNGRPGMGNFDIYYTTYDEATDSWGEVKNIGYPINTDADDGALFISLDGATAYYTSDRHSLDNNIKPNLDIYKFDLYPEARPTPTTYVSGIVKDGNTGKPLAADILISGANGERNITTDASGAFLITLPAQSDYSFQANKEGYLFASERFAIKEIKTALEPFLLEITLYPIPTKEEPSNVVYDKPIILKNVLFQSGSAVLLPESMQEINQISELLVSNPDVKISIYGHTDNVGNESDNLRLSEQRAKAVYDILANKGIQRNRLAYTGYGESKPIADNGTEVGRQENRRTEFVVRR